MALLKTWIFHVDGFTPLKEFANILFKCFLLKWAIQEVLCRIRLRKDVSRNNYGKCPGLSFYPLLEIHDLKQQPEIEKRIYSPVLVWRKHLEFLLLDHSQSNCCSILNPPKMQPLIAMWWKLNMVRTMLNIYPKEVAPLGLHISVQPQPPAHSLRAPPWSPGSCSASCCGLEGWW